ncbi:DUF4374 domain-containing protein [Mesonia aestuariivivens]|uniref:DUF4374 domain-containing protein n=1 Tax=Mesonia aestuariivivens TaxID=2796128 RepID=A0ABS6W351_9FLAO|nr:DUF4374 domain-containing protein [Mesonia aestuariivivens]MBW2961967.1 DUF4374 domain-containing protein [Mesonia aestuariivivens]
MNILLRKKLYVSVAFAAMLGFTSCSDDDGEDNTVGCEGVATEEYVVAATSEENSYVLTKENISEGELSIVGDGLQVTGTPSWFFYKNLAAYSFVYRQGDPGTTQSFILEDCGLEPRNPIDLQVSIQSKGIVGEELFVQYSSRNYENPEATFYKVNGKTSVVTGPVTINTKELANNGEYAYITDITEHNSRVWIAYRTIKAGEDNEDNAFNSDFNDHTYIAIFNEDLEFIQRIEDTGRTGVIAGQSRSQGETGIEPVENGDVYVFSSALDAPEVNSGVLKINNGTTEFDPNYFFNISEASGGYKLYRTHYVGDNTFVLQMFTEQNIASARPTETRHKFAVVNVATKSFNWVDDVPNGIQEIGAPYVDKANKEVVFPIKTSENPRLYIINAANHVMTAGTKIEADGVTAVGKLAKQ